MANFSFPSAMNTFVPSHKATAGLMVGFSRNPKSFKINKYIQIMPVDKPIGLWATWNSKQAARVRTNNISDFVWPPGTPAPTGKDNLESFGYTQYRTVRYAFPFTMDDMTIKTADWGVLQAHADVMAGQCMTARELVAYGVWSTPANWGTHCANVDGVGGFLNGNAALLPNNQNWTNGSETVPNFKRTLNRARRLINQDTLGVMDPSDVGVVFNPNTAMQLAESPEIHSYLARSEFALAQVRGDKPGQNTLWGLPDIIAGSEIIVDDTVLDTAQKPTDNLAYMIPDGTALITSRKGGLEGIGGGPAYSTLVLFYFEDDMTVESYHNVNDRLTHGRVVSNFTVNLTTPSSGFLLNRALG